MLNYFFCDFLWWQFNFTTAYIISSYFTIIYLIYSTFLYLLLIIDNNLGCCWNGKTLTRTSIFCFYFQLLLTCLNNFDNLFNLLLRILQRFLFKSILELYSDLSEFYANNLFFPFIVRNQRQNLFHGDYFIKCSFFVGLLFNSSVFVHIFIFFLISDRCDCFLWWSAVLWHHLLCEVQTQQHSNVSSFRWSDVQMCDGNASDATWRLITRLQLGYVSVCTPVSVHVCVHVHVCLCMSMCVSCQSWFLMYEGVDVLRS